MTAALRQFPNFLTAVRVLLAPLTAYFVLHGQDFLAFCVFAFAGASDALDGFLARRFGLVSRFGEYLDPAADKLLMLACFVTLTLIQQTPLWLTAIVIGRDLAIVLGIALAWALSLPLKVEALMVGKASTVVQVGYVGLVLLLLTFNLVMPALATVAAIITAGFAVLSGLAYAQLFVRALAPGRRPA